MKPVQNERSFSQMSKYNEEISEAKGKKNCIGKWEYSSFIEIWNFKLFRTGTIKTKTRARVPSASLRRGVFRELISAARVSGKETDPSLSESLLENRNSRTAKRLGPSGSVSMERCSLEIPAATEKFR